MVELACSGGGVDRLLRGVFGLSPCEDDVFLLLLLRQVGALTNCVIVLDLNYLAIKQRQEGFIYFGSAKSLLFLKPLCRLRLLMRPVTLREGINNLCSFNYHDKTRLTRDSKDFWKEEAIFESSPELRGPSRVFLRAEPIGSYTEAGIAMTSSLIIFINSTVDHSCKSSLL